MPRTLSRVRRSFEQRVSVEVSRRLRSVNGKLRSECERVHKAGVRTSHSDYSVDGRGKSVPKEQPLLRRTSQAVLSPFDGR